MKVTKIAFGLILMLSVAVVESANSQEAPKPEGQSVPKAMGTQTQSQEARGTARDYQSDIMSGGSNVVGCVVKEGDHFALKTKDDTYPLNVERDLTSVVGKKVQIKREWTASTSTPAAGAAASSAGNPAAAGDTPAFVGELGVRVTAYIVGSCTESEMK